MSVKVAIFEDDKDVAELLMEMMESKDFSVQPFYNLKDIGWQSCDVILGDFRNKIVAFKTLQSECSKRNIPLVAISGADTDYSPQLIKPFSLEVLQATILEALKKNKIERTVVEHGGFLTTLFKKTS